MLVLTDLESGRERVHDPRAGDAAHRAEAVRQLEETEQTFRRLRLDAARIVLGDRAGRLDEASLTEEQLTYVEPLVELFRRRARRH
jgi:predicted kinase